MLAAVFAFQPVGKLIAVLMAFATTTGMRSRIASFALPHGPLSCSVAARDAAAMERARSIDRSWRLVAGLGTVPALIAIYFRYTIPETVSSHHYLWLQLLAREHMAMLILRLIGRWTWPKTLTRQCTTAHFSTVSIVPTIYHPFCCAFRN